MNQIKIIHEPTPDEPFVVLEKERGIPSAPLKEGDLSAFTLACQKFPQLGQINSRKAVEGGLLHRIDTQTKGLLLIAASQEFYDHMIQEQNSGRFVKRYGAICKKMDKSKMLPGFSEFQMKQDIREGMDFLLSSRFRAFGEKGREVRPVSESDGKYALKKASADTYTTKISLQQQGLYFKATCHLAKGYRHQVRCHLAWIGFPILADPLYFPCSEPESKEEFAFVADGLFFSWNEKSYSFEI